MFKSFKKIVLYLVFILTIFSLSSCGDSSSTRGSTIIKGKDSLKQFLQNISEESNCNYEYLVQKNLNGFGNMQEIYHVDGNIVYSTIHDWYFEIIGEKSYKYLNKDEYWEKNENNFEVFQDDIDPRSFDSKDFDYIDNRFILKEDNFSTKKYPFEKLIIELNENNNGCEITGVLNDGGYLYDTKYTIRKYNKVPTKLPDNIGANIFYNKYRSEFSNYACTYPILDLIQIGEKRLYRANSSYFPFDPILVYVNGNKIEEVKFDKYSPYAESSELTKKIISSGYLNSFKNIDLSYYIVDKQIENIKGLEKECESIKDIINGIIFAETTIIKE